MLLRNLRPILTKLNECNFCNKRSSMAFNKQNVFHLLDSVYAHAAAHIQIVHGSFLTKPLFFLTYLFEIKPHKKEKPSTKQKQNAVILTKLATNLLLAQGFAVRWHCQACCPVLLSLWLRMRRINEYLWMKWSVLWRCLWNTNVRGSAHKLGFVPATHLWRIACSLQTHCPYHHVRWTSGSSPGSVRANGTNGPLAHTSRARHWRWKVFLFFPRSCKTQE